jgi:hypothetical protein
MLREFYLIALTRGETPQSCGGSVAPSGAAAVGDSAAGSQNSCRKATWPTTAGRDEHDRGPQRDLAPSTDDRAQPAESTCPGCEEAPLIESPHPPMKLAVTDQYVR